jgi:hypothetical protein
MKQLGTNFSFYEFLSYEQVLGTFTKLRKAFSCLSVPPSFHPRQTTRSPLNEFSFNSIFLVFSKTLS